MLLFDFIVSCYLKRDENFKELRINYSFYLLWIHQTLLFFSSPVCRLVLFLLTDSIEKYQIKFLILCRWWRRKIYTETTLFLIRKYECHRPPLVLLWQWQIGVSIVFRWRVILRRPPLRISGQFLCSGVCVCVNYWTSGFVENVCTYSTYQYMKYYRITDV